MKSQIRPDGELQLNVLQGIELAVAQGQALAARVESVEVQEQLRGEPPPPSLQLVVTIEAAEALGQQLLEQVRDTRAEPDH